MSEPLLQAEGLCYSVDGADLVSKVYLNVEAGEFVGVIGPNGAGKSTLLQLLGGDLQPTSGSVLIGGFDVKSLAPRQLAISRAMLGADPATDISFPVRAVVEAGRFPHRGSAGSSPDEDRRRVEAAMAVTGVAHLAARPFRTLSTGERARVLVARVLAQASPLSFLDEPTAALDVANVEAVLRTLGSAASRDSAMVCVIHDLNAAAFYCDRLVLVGGGRVVADGSPERVLDQALLSEVYSHEIRVTAHPFRPCPLVLVGGS